MLHNLGAEIEPVAFIQLKNCRIAVCSPNETTAWRVDTFWDKEPDTLRWIDTFKPDDLFVDIGANIGLYSLYAVFSRGVDAIAFEPESLNYALLNKNIFLNRIDRKMKAYPVALSNEMAFNAIHLSQFVAGGSCHNFKEKLNCQHEPLLSEFSQGCFSVPLDLLIKEKWISVPQHIKIDVDGIEHKILEGATETLKNPNVRSLLVELNTDLLPHRQVLDRMQENGFVCFNPQTTQESGPFKNVANWIFFREPKSEWDRHFSFAKLAQK